MEPLPIHYHLEVFEGSFEGDASLSVITSTPTPSFAVGDTLDHRGFDRWDSPPGKEEVFRVAEVRHILWEVPRPAFVTNATQATAKPFVGHKLMVRLEVVSLPR